MGQLSTFFFHIPSQFFTRENCRASFAFLTYFFPLFCPRSHVARGMKRQKAEDRLSRDGRKKCKSQRWKRNEKGSAGSLRVVQTSFISESCPCARALLPAFAALHLMYSLNCCCSRIVFTCCGCVSNKHYQEVICDFVKRSRSTASGDTVCSISNSQCGLLG